MNVWIKMIDKILHPHRGKQEKLMSRMVEYRELSSLALESENRVMYSLLQREMNEMFCEYLTWCFLDGIGYLIPHALVMWLISARFPYFTFPFDLPLIGNQVSVIVWYPLAMILYYVTRWLVRKRTSSVLVNPAIR